MDIGKQQRIITVEPEPIRQPAIEPEPVKPDTVPEPVEVPGD